MRNSSQHTSTLDPINIPYEQRRRGDNTIWLHVIPSKDVNNANASSPSNIGSVSVGRQLSLFQKKLVEIERNRISRQRAEQRGYITTLTLPNSSLCHAFATQSQKNPDLRACIPWHKTQGYQLHKANDATANSSDPLQIPSLLYRSP